MKYFSKIRIAWFFVILLSAVNITILSIFFCGINHHEDHFDQKNEKSGCPEKQECMLKSELKLDEQQTIKYELIKKDHHLKAKSIVDSLKATRTTLMVELKKDLIADGLIESLVSQINGYNNRLFELSIIQYIEIKKILKPEQQESLSKVYSDMFGCKSHRDHNNKRKGCDSSKQCE
ncbi:MAG: hypothetical protein WCP69_08260 [Bacteroidota bacterium]